jgi:DNA-binding transcriptional ArsR family regulator
MSGKSAVTSELFGAAPVFAALGDPMRLRIVARLCGGGPLSTVQLKEGAGISRQGITKHLHALERAGVVRSGRLGRERVWELETKRLAEVRRHLEQISLQWDEALARLRVLVETEDQR